MSRMLKLLHQRSDSSTHTWPLAVIFLAAITGLSRSHTILEEYSCGQGDIEYQSTLKGGTRAGLFHKHGEVKNIHECIHHCCQSKKCDVALMEGKQCFGVQCLNETLCESVPAPPGAQDSFQISHVSTKGLNFANEKKALKPASLHDDDLDAREGRCPFNGVMYNVKLKGGLKAGRFTDVGKVKSVNTCIRYCCDSKVPCDLSFMLDDRCYLVKCYSEERCEAVPANSQDFAFKQRMAFVSPWLFKRNKKIMKVPSGLNQHHLKCVQTKLHTNTDLVGGPYAGDFKDMGNVGKPHRCTRMCCEDQDCDVAYMVGQNCFLVKCYSDDLCKLKTHNATLGEDIKKSSRSVQFIVKRDFDVTMDENGKVRERHPDHRKCSMDGDVHNNTELLLGMLSGKLTPHTKVKEMKECLGKCCDDKSCHVAVMNAGMCYSVHCDQPQLCQTKPAGERAKLRNPQVAYVMRGEDSIYKEPPPPPPPPPPKENVTLPSNETASSNKTSPLNQTEAFNSTDLFNYYIQHYNMSHNATTAWFDKTSNNSMAGLYFFNNTWQYNPFWNITNLNITELEMSGSGSGMFSGSGSGIGESDESIMEEEDDDEPPIEIIDEDEEQKRLNEKANSDSVASASGAKESGSEEASLHVSGDGNKAHSDSSGEGSGIASISGESDSGSAMENINDVKPFAIPTEHSASGSGMKSDGSVSGMGADASGTEIKHDASGTEIKHDASGTEMQHDSSGMDKKNEKTSSKEGSGSVSSGVGSGSGITEDGHSETVAKKKETIVTTAAQSDITESENDMDLAGLLTPVDEEPKQSDKEDTGSNTDSGSASLKNNIEEETKFKNVLESKAEKQEDTHLGGSGEKAKDDTKENIQNEGSASVDKVSSAQNVQDIALTASGDSKEGKDGKEEKIKADSKDKELSATGSGTSVETLKANSAAITKGESSDGSGTHEVQSGSTH